MEGRVERIRGARAELDIRKTGGVLLEHRSERLRVYALDHAARSSMDRSAKDVVTRTEGQPRAAEGTNVEAGRKAEAEPQMVGGAFGLELVKEPKAFLVTR